MSLVKITGSSATTASEYITTAPSESDGSRRHSNPRSVRSWRGLASKRDRIANHLLRSRTEALSGLLRPRDVERDNASGPPAVCSAPPRRRCVSFVATLGGLEGKARSSRGALDRGCGLPAVRCVDWLG